LGVNETFLKTLKLELPTTFIIYAVAHKTKNEPNWVHIKKYNDA